MDRAGSADAVRRAKGEPHHSERSARHRQPDIRRERSARAFHADPPLSVRESLLLRFPISNRERADPMVVADLGSW